LVLSLPDPDMVVLPELALCSYMASMKIWQYADDCGRDTSAWAIEMAQKYDTYIGVGYLDYDNGDYYNRYLIAGKDGVYGVVTKSEGESAVFKRGWFDNIIKMPFGNVGVAICYDARRRHFYDNVRKEELALILFPHGCPSDPDKADDETKAINFICRTYSDAFDIPVVYVNSRGKLEEMPGVMGNMMKRAGFRMNGGAVVCSAEGCCILTDTEGIAGMDVPIRQKSMKKQIQLYGNNLISENWLFRWLILVPDTRRGIRSYKYYRKNAPADSRCQPVHK